MILVCVTRIKVKLLYYPDKCILLCFDISDTELSSSPESVKIIRYNIKHLKQTVT